MDFQQPEDERGTRVSSGHRPIPLMSPRRSRAVDMKLEVVVVPVANVDRAKEFYTGLGWREDADFAPAPDYRVVQVTPPGSDCSVIFGAGITSAAPGSAEGLILAVADIETARQEFAARGVDVGEVFHPADGVFIHAGGAERAPGPAPDRSSYGSYLSFTDPDGNGWFVQEVTTRRPGRVDPGRAAYDSSADLAEALRRAEAAHGKHEAELGERDENWPDWYAQYLIEERQAPSTSA
jgi:catechol 2,3-dioxygenase-like lactoylglutathione lyase family enzyme